MNELDKYIYECRNAEKIKLTKRVDKFILDNDLIHKGYLSKELSNGQFQITGDEYAEEFKRVRELILELIKDVEIEDNFEEHVALIILNVGK